MAQSTVSLPFSFCFFFSSILKYVFGDPLKLSCGGGGLYVGLDTSPCLHVCLARCLPIRVYQRRSSQVLPSRSRVHVSPRFDLYLQSAKRRPRGEDMTFSCLSATWHSFIHRPVYIHLHTPLSFTPDASMSTLSPA